MLVLDVPPTELIEDLTEELKQFPELTPPEWAEYSKTGISRELPPTQEDWWYRRAASIMRKLAKSKKPLGVGTLREMYGGRHRRGVKPNKHADGSGHIIRTLLQQLEEAGLLTKAVERNGTILGRTLTTKGKKLINAVARKVKARHEELSRY